MKIEQIEISKIKPNKDNPRIIKDDKFKKLVNSILEFPDMLQMRPIVVNDKMVVLGGNMRLKACKEAKLKEVYYFKFTPAHAKKANEKAGTKKTYKEWCDEFVVKDNVSFGEWDWDKIANEWDSEKVESWGLDVWVEKETVDIKKDVEGFETSTLWFLNIQMGSEETCAKLFDELKGRGFEVKIVN
jgi:hypothetical protein